MKIVVGNQKASLTKNEFEAFQITLKNRIRCDVEVVICPSMLYLSCYDRKSYYLGSQNVSPLKTNALTGEVTASQLKQLGTSYCLVGHTERRTTLNETDELIQEKIKRLLEQGITPILCVGENKEEHLLLKTGHILEKQIDKVCKSLTKEERRDLIIAYEPTWAIGTGMMPKKEDIKRSINIIKEIFMCKYEVEVRVLYGGSITQKNIKMLENIDEIDGYLIGGESLDANHFLAILNEMN